MAHTGIHAPLAHLEIPLLLSRQALAQYVHQAITVRAVLQQSNVRLGKCLPQGRRHARTARLELVLLLLPLHAQHAWPVIIVAEVPPKWRALLEKVLQLAHQPVPTVQQAIALFLLANV